MQTTRLTRWLAGSHSEARKHVGSQADTILGEQAGRLPSRQRGTWTNNHPDRQHTDRQARHKALRLITNQERNTAMMQGEFILGQWMNFRLGSTSDLINLSGMFQLAPINPVWIFAPQNTPGPPHNTTHRALLSSVIIYRSIRRSRSKGHAQTNGHTIPHPVTWQANIFEVVFLIMASTMLNSG